VEKNVKVGCSHYMHLEPPSGTNVNRIETNVKVGGSHYMHLETSVGDECQQNRDECQGRWRRMSRSVVPTTCIWKPPSGTNVNRTETNVKVGGCTSKHLLKYSQVYSQFNLSILTLLLLLTYCRTILLPYSSSTAVICPA